LYTPYFYRSLGFAPADSVRQLRAAQIVSTENRELAIPDDDISKKSKPRSLNWARLEFVTDGEKAFFCSKLNYRFPSFFLLRAPLEREI